MTPEFQSRLDGLCAAYREFLAGHATELLVGEVVVLHGSEAIEECNEVHEVAEYLPGYVCIGSDSGDFRSEAVKWCRDMRRCEA